MDLDLALQIHKNHPSKCPSKSLDIPPLDGGGPAPNSPPLDGSPKKDHTAARFLRRHARQGGTRSAPRKSSRGAAWRLRSFSWAHSTLADESRHLRMSLSFRKPVERTYALGGRTHSAEWLPSNRNRFGGPGSQDIWRKHDCPPHRPDRQTQRSPLPCHPGTTSAERYPDAPQQDHPT